MLFRSVLALLASSVGELPNRRGAPHLARSKEQLEKLLARLRVAHAIALNDDGAELVALELRHALDALGEIAGTISSDDLLGKIFFKILHRKVIETGFSPQPKWYPILRIRIFFGRLPMIQMKIRQGG